METPSLGFPDLAGRCLFIEIINHKSVREEKVK